ncbi:MAG: phosphatidylserine decarboxylase [Desulfobacterales bacterium]
MNIAHQYIERNSACVKNETLFADRLINAIWSDKRENSSLLFKMLSSATMSDLLAFFTYDLPLGAKISGMPRFAKNMGIDLSECVNAPQTPRELFERKIRYWQTRPMPADPGCIVSPADARMLPGSFARSSRIFLKEKFFDYAELLGEDKTQWQREFHEGDYAVFRLTPDKYHYNHVPVSGKVVDFYEIQGNYSPCNPGAAMTVCTPHSKNKRALSHNH